MKSLNNKLQWFPILTGILIILGFVFGFYNIYNSIFSESFTSMGRARLFSLLVFSGGYILQFLFLITLNKGVDKKNLKLNILTALAVGLLVFILPSKHEQGYDIFIHSFMALISMGILLSLNLKESLSPRINEQTIFIWVLILAYLFIVNQVSFILWILFLPIGFLSILNLYTNWDRHIVVRVILYAMFLALIIGVYFIHFHFSDLGFIFNKASSLTIIDSLAIGMFMGYIIPYFAFLSRLWPFPGKHQTWKSHREELKDTTKDFARYFDPNKNFPLKNTIIGLFIIIFLYINYIFRFISEAYLITLVLVLVRVLDVVVEKYS